MSTPKFPTATVTIRRSDPAAGVTAFEQRYQVPIGDRTTLLEALDYIYERLDPTLAYYDHSACGQSICRRCTALVDGKTTLLCQTPLTGDVTIEPPAHLEVVRDLVCANRSAHRWDGVAGTGPGADGGQA